jgi:hypothetical protein
MKMTGSAAAEEEGGRQETRATLRLENVRTVGKRGGGGRRRSDQRGNTMRMTGHWDGRVLRVLT